MFENKEYKGIYYTRFIASFNKYGDARRDRKRFKEWLCSLVINGEYLPDDVIDGILFLADNGKLELEIRAERFLEDYTD